MDDEIYYCVAWYLLGILSSANKTILFSRISLKGFTYNYFEYFFIYRSMSLKPFLSVE